MPSLRKKVTEFLRQLSANNNVHFDAETVETKDDKAHGCFIQRYLNGEHKGGLGSTQVTDREGPTVFHGGRDGSGLPNLRLQAPHPDIFAAYTGPDGGLTTVNRGCSPRHGGEGGGNSRRRAPERHLSTDDPDVNFIDEGKEEGKDVSKTSDSKATQKLEKLLVDTDVDAAEESEILDKEVAGICGGWDRWNRRAYGVAQSLYERHPVSGHIAGSPVADAFAIVARKDSALLALADGVNWGPKAATAARAALHGSLRHLHVALYNPPASIIRVKDTKEVFVALLRSFHEAHSMILQEEGMLTTLTVAAVLPIAYGEGRVDQVVNWDSEEEEDEELGPRRWAVCVVNVGDSLAYVYSKAHGVREITMGSHDINCMRDMRDALGALGPADGQNPELNNLTCSLTIACPGDVVFLTSDGVSDNFDPVVGKFAVPKVEIPNNPGEGASSPSKATGGGKTDATKKNSNKGGGGVGGSRSHHGEATIPTSKSTGNVVGETGPGRPKPRPKLPVVEAHQRHALTLLRMEDLLVNGVSGEGTPDDGPDAYDLCHRLVEFATRLTAAKRHILEDPELYTDEGDGSSSAPLGRSEQRGRRRKVCERLAAVPGKLDHASVVAYVVGEYAAKEDKENASEILISQGRETNGSADNRKAVSVARTSMKDQCPESRKKNNMKDDVISESGDTFHNDHQHSLNKEGQDSNGGDGKSTNTKCISLPKVEELSDDKESMEPDLFETGL